MCRSRVTTGSVLLLCYQRVGQPNLDFALVDRRLRRPSAAARMNKRDCLPLPYSLRIKKAVTSRAVFGLLP